MAQQPPVQEQQQAAGKQQQQQLYPDLYEGPGPASTDGGDSGGSSIVAAVGGVVWEILPASQTLKVREAAGAAISGDCRRATSLPAARSLTMLEHPQECNTCLPVGWRTNFHPVHPAARRVLLW